MLVKIFLIGLIIVIFTTLGFGFYHGVLSSIWFWISFIGIILLILLGYTVWDLLRKRVNVKKVKSNLVARFEEQFYNIPQIKNDNIEEEEEDELQLLLFKITSILKLIQIRERKYLEENTKILYSREYLETILDNFQKGNQELFLNYSKLFEDRIDFLSKNLSEESEYSEGSLNSYRKNYQKILIDFEEIKQKQLIYKNLIYESSNKEKYNDVLIKIKIQLEKDKQVLNHREFESIGKVFLEELKEKGKVNLEKAQKEARVVINDYYTNKISDNDYIQKLDNIIMRLKFLLNRNRRLLNVIYNDAGSSGWENTFTKIIKLLEKESKEISLKLNMFIGDSIKERE